MIKLKNIWKSYWTKGSQKYVARDLCLEFPRRKAIAILGRNGAGKSTLLRIMSGTEDPDSGEVQYSGKVSWPIGFAGSFHPELSGAQNVRFVARIYGIDTNELISYVDDVADLGTYLNEPIRTYSAGMKARLSFAVSLGISFDTYLIDEITAVGDQRFRQKSSELMKNKLKDSGAVIVTHSLGFVKDVCDSVVILQDGNADVFDNVDEGIEEHKRRMWLANNNKH